MRSMFVKLAVFASCSLFVLNGCDKDDDPAVSSGDYSPMTTGSTWTYSNTPGGTSVLTASGRDTVALGRTYRVFTNSNGNNTYLAKDKENYYRFGVLPIVGNFEEYYLKGDAKVNDTWNTVQTTNYMGIPVTATLTYVVKEKGISRTVSGKSYTNVVHVRLDVSANVGGNIGGGDFYYAGGIGLIEGNLSITAPGQLPTNQVQLLTAYDIK